MSSHFYQYLGGIRRPGKYVFDVRVTGVATAGDGMGESQAGCREWLVAVDLDLAVSELEFIGVNFILG